ncbi:MAG: 5'-3' exonuclease H3TH domain-containing protein [Verrucomicrobiota bacterium]|nr:5'-3' exonuclease H3TH domain-containing protein [Verrucomicrobiota bacterium]
MSKSLLCDGHNLAFRAFYGIRELSRSDGFPTNMVHGWLRSFWRLEDDWKPDEIWIFFDKGGSRRREEILPSYKANRGLPPEGFSEQLEWVKRLSKALGHGCLEREGLEADDLIASAVRQRTETGLDSIVVSADKDLCQLIGPATKQLLPPPTANPRLGWRLLDEDGVLEKFGVPPSGILDYLSVIGDQADNIPGLSGVGPKTARKWMEDHCDLEALIANAGRLTPKRFCSVVYEKREELLRNRELIRLESDLDLDMEACPAFDLSALKEILLELEMNKSWEEAQRRYT